VCHTDIRSGATRVHCTRYPAIREILRKMARGGACSQIRESLHDLTFIQISALSFHYSEEGAGAAGAAFFCITHKGKLLQHKLIRVPCTKKVPKYRCPLYRSTGIRFKQVILN
jgi:hypothetical protein